MTISYSGLIPKSRSFLHHEAYALEMSCIPSISVLHIQAPSRKILSAIVENVGLKQNENHY